MTLSIALCIVLAQAAHCEGEAEIWRCGNLLTNQPSLDAVDNENNKCQLLSTKNTPITVPAGVQHSKSLAKNASAGALVRSEVWGSEDAGVTDADQQSSRDQMSRAILLAEKDRLTSRQSALEERLRSKSLNTVERQEIENELSRNSADLNGLRREIAKHP